MYHNTRGFHGSDRFLVTVTYNCSLKYYTVYIFRDLFESQVQELLKQIKDKENELTLIEEQQSTVIKEKDAKITSLHQNIEVLQNDVYLRDQQQVCSKFTFFLLYSLLRNSVLEQRVCGFKWIFIRQQTINLDGVQVEVKEEEAKRSSQEVAADIEKMAKEMADLKKKLQMEKIIKDETIKKLEQVTLFVIFLDSGTYMLLNQVIIETESPSQRS